MGILEGKSRFFADVEKASYLERPNRFTLVCRLNGRVVEAFLPNPGRLWELLLPEATVYLERSHSPGGKMPYVAVAIQREGHPVMVHTHRTNDLANELIERGLVPGLEGSEVIKREVRKGKSRFDFLLRKGQTEIILEVKSCTLFGERIAMFPDAVTSRGRRHVEELAALATEVTAGAILFLIYSPGAQFFLPEYHTDLEFTRALLAARERISIFPVALELGEDLSLTSRVRTLKVPWRIVEREAEDRGSYILLLRLPKEARREIGNLGEVRFREGYYLYIGSGRKNLSRRIERHRRILKKHFWHIDFLRAIAEFHFALPIRTEDVLECEIARAVKGVAGWEIPHFGSSDCSCSSHLYGMPSNPLGSANFISLLQYFRMDRLIGGEG